MTAGLLCFVAGLLGALGLVCWMVVAVSLPGRALAVVLGLLVLGLVLP